MTDEAPTLGYDPAALKFAGPDAIRAALPHRHEFELLDGVLTIDPAGHGVVGYVDARPDSFWVRGHFPRAAVMPGVLMLEAAAQLTCFYVIHQKVVPPGTVMGLGGVEDARFHRPVRPGDRLVLVGRGLKVHRRLNRFRVTGYVGAAKAFEATIVGVPLGGWEELSRAEA